jgi:hypothetical protein
MPRTRVSSFYSPALPPRDPALTAPDPAQSEQDFAAGLETVETGLWEEDQQKRMLLVSATLRTSRDFEFVRDGCAAGRFIRWTARRRR